MKVYIFKKSAVGQTKWEYYIARKVESKEWNIYVNKNNPVDVEARNGDFSNCSWVETLPTKKDCMAYLEDSQKDRI